MLSWWRRYDDKYFDPHSLQGTLEVWDQDYQQGSCSVFAAIPERDQEFLPEKLCLGWYFSQQTQWFGEDSPANVPSRIPPTPALEEEEEVWTECVLLLSANLWRCLCPSCDGVTCVAVGSARFQAKVHINPNNREEIFGFLYESSRWKGILFINCFYSFVISLDNNSWWVCR